jgi:hypothetical protein
MSDTAPQETDPPARPAGAYLPRLPAGWRYSINLDKADGTAEGVAIRTGGGTFRVSVNGGAGPGGAFLDKPTLAEALRAGVKAAKALDQVAEHKAKASAVEQELLGSLQTALEDGEDDDPTDPTPAEKVPA